MALERDEAHRKLLLFERAQPGLCLQWTLNIVDFQYLIDCLAWLYVLQISLAIYSSLKMIIMVHKSKSKRWSWGYKNVRPCSCLRNVTWVMFPMYVPGTVEQMEATLVDCKFKYAMDREQHEDLEFRVRHELEPEIDVRKSRVVSFPIWTNLFVDDL
jgi:hypothetical protein